ncbi:MAG: hypothetical protein SFU86_19310 [Pirellulaceae bacterium]|nr:hypothetical protein [Pirellulaceae bacterium]
MKPAFRRFAFALSAAGLLFTVDLACADYRQVCDKVEGIAIRARNHCRELAKQIRNQRLPLGEAYGDLASAQQVADHLRRVADNYGSPEQIAADVEQLTLLVAGVSQQLRGLQLDWGPRTSAGDIRNLNRLVDKLREDVTELQVRLAMFGSWPLAEPNFAPEYEPPLPDPEVSSQPWMPGPELIAPQAQPIPEILPAPRSR